MLEQIKQLYVFILALRARLFNHDADQAWERIQVGLGKLEGLSRGS